jgi:hypothetical protein
MQRSSVSGSHVHSIQDSEVHYVKDIEVYGFCVYICRERERVPCLEYRSPTEDGAAPCVLYRIPVSAFRRRFFSGRGGERREDLVSWIILILRYLLGLANLGGNGYL